MREQRKRKFVPELRHAVLVSCEVIGRQSQSFTNEGAERVFREWGKRVAGVFEKIWVKSPQFVCRHTISMFDYICDEKKLVNTHGSIHR